MKKLLMLGCLFVVFMCVAAPATADTFTTSSCNLDFAVNDSGSFYVRNSRIVPAGSPPGLEASSSISGPAFNLSATSAGYSDAGIVLYFDGRLKLGDLKSASVVSSGSPVSINLWLDTGGDGRFFTFNGSGLMTGLNGDSYGSHSGASLDATSSIYMMGGNGAGQTYTLTQLQAGVIPGINGNTRAALWIGITNNGSAAITGVTVRTAAENALQNGGDTCRHAECRRRLGLAAHRRKRAEYEWSHCDGTCKGIFPHRKRKPARGFAKSRRIPVGQNKYVYDCRRL